MEDSSPAGAGKESGNTGGGSLILRRTESRLVLLESTGERDLLELGTNDDVENHHYVSIDNAFTGIEGDRSLILVVFLEEVCQIWQRIFSVAIFVERLVVPLFSTDFDADAATIVRLQASNLASLRVDVILAPIRFGFMIPLATSISAQEGFPG